MVLGYKSFDFGYNLYSTGAKLCINSAFFGWKSSLQTCDWVLINHGMYTSTLDDHWFFICVSHMP